MFRDNALHKIGEEVPIPNRAENLASSIDIPVRVPAEIGPLESRISAATAPVVTGGGIRGVRDRGLRGARGKWTAGSVRRRRVVPSLGRAIGPRGVLLFKFVVWHLQPI